MNAASDKKSAQFEIAPAGDLLRVAAARFGALTALDFFGARTSYATLGAQAAAAAASLAALGVTRGTKVGLCLPNTPFYVIMYFAVLQAGGTVVNFNPLYTEREIETQARMTGVSIMVSLDLAMIHDKIARLAANGVFERVIMCRFAAALPPLKRLLFRLLKRKDIAQNIKQDGDKLIEFAALLKNAATAPAVTIDPLTDIALLQFTGGTTGTPKAAALTHANVTVNVAQVSAALKTLEPGAERIVAVLPFFHVFAMTAILNFGLSIGGELILIPRMDMKVLLAAIARRRPTVMPGVPTLFTALCGAGVDLSCLRTSISGGAPLPAELLERFETLSGCSIYEGYGLSETSPVVAFNAPGFVRRGSVGRAIPGTAIEIRSPEPPYAILPQGERGEICVRGPQVMAGYYERPADTAAVFLEGALRTGDVGYLDEDGYLFIVDRLKDLIICGGYNVYPRVIEEAAYLHPAVQDAVAIGVPDKYRGQAPKLFVTLRPGTSATGAEILTFLNQHLNKIEIPRSVEIRDSLPKTMVGKLSKKELVAEAAAQPL